MDYVPAVDDMFERHVSAMAYLCEGDVSLMAGLFEGDVPAKVDLFDDFLVPATVGLLGVRPPILQVANSYLGDQV